MNLNLNDLASNCNLTEKYYQYDKFKPDYNKTYKTDEEKIKYCVSSPIPIPITKKNFVYN